MTAQQVSRPLTTIVAADVAGYSRLIAHDEEATLAGLRGLRKELIEPPLGSCNVRTDHAAGESFALERAAENFPCSRREDTELFAKGLCLSGLQ